MPIPKSTDTELIDNAFQSLAAVPGLNVADWMLMSYTENPQDFWNGTKLYHFKNRETRLYIFVPSRWGFQGDSLPVSVTRSIHSPARGRG